jgi:hypothetical protein
MAIPGLIEGRDVHFYDGTYKGDSSMALKPSAAKVAAVLDAESGCVNLSRLLPGGEWLPWPDVPYSESPKPGCWSWMERA